MNSKLSNWEIDMKGVFLIGLVLAMAGWASPAIANGGGHHNGCGGGHHGYNGDRDEMLCHGNSLEVLSHVAACGIDPSDVPDLLEMLCEQSPPC
jgi:hypothetical protein